MASIHPNGSPREFSSGRFRSPWARYGFGLLTVAIALVLKSLWADLTGYSSSFLILFAATLVTSLFAGTGPGFFVLLLSMALGGYLFMRRTGSPLSHAFLQSLLFSVDGGVILYVTALTNRRRRIADDANRELSTLRDDAERAAAYIREVIELAPDPFFLADLEGRLTDVNQAACRLLDFRRDELIGRTAFDLMPAEEAAHLEKVRADLMEPGTVNKGEWTLKRRDGTLVPVEASSNILKEGRWQAFVRDITERKRIEDQRQVFVSLLDNSVDFIGIADPTGKPIYLNAAGRRMIGLAPDFPIETLAIYDCYPPDLRAFVDEVIIATMKERGAWSGDTFFVNFQTHARIPVSDTHFLIRDTSGRRVIGMGTVTRDISEARRVADEREQSLAREHEARSQAERANAQLRESEERFRLTIDDAPIGMALVSLDGRYVRVNRVMSEITGYTTDELSHLRFHDITHPDDLDTDVDIAERLSGGHIPRYQFEKRYIRKDKSIVDVLLNVSIMRGPDNEPRYFITQVEDISERKRAEQAVRLSEAKFSGIVSIAADAIISVDPEQRITVFNTGAEKIFGYRASDALGMQLERLIPERFRTAHRNHFAGFAAGGEAARTMATRQEVFGLRKTGEEFPAEASISKVTAGAETFFSVVLRDITYRKSVETALQRALSARDDVLRIVAHDLRNPLSAIMMQAALMEREGPEPERRDPQPRQVIQRAATRMNQLIQDLLDVALAEEGQLRIAPARLAVTELVRDETEMQAPIAASAELTLRFEVKPGVREVWGDRQRLLQVFENLIGNAIKFTKPGGQIVVSATPTDGEVVFSVADSGVGMERDAAEHVFDRFWQVASKTKRLGAGLGLPITKGIVEAHGGRIWLESEPGRGSTFSFSIPIAARTQKPQWRRLRRPKAPKAGGPGGSG
jgi:PAS domain S-box-containing protein